ncbi:MAG: hypothetical protein SCK29_00175 [Bacillota bacterium]|nr:hypothetical protein [Bacillota bacterium]MDW7682516.1 hypothetical protein [Bacillota bacterium]
MQALIILLILLVASLQLRIHNKKRFESHEVPEHTKPSPLSEALQELVATAGGIYLSLVLLVSFLQIDLADHWLIISVEMDPLAFIALILSILQPMFLRIVNYFKGVR